MSQTARKEGKNHSSSCHPMDDESGWALIAELKGGCDASSDVAPAAPPAHILREAVGNVDLTQIPMPTGGMGEETSMAASNMKSPPNFSCRPPRWTDTEVSKIICY